MVKHTQTFKTIHGCILYSYITEVNDMKYIGTISVDFNTQQLLSYEICSK